MQGLVKPGGVPAAAGSRSNVWAGRGRAAPQQWAADPPLLNLPTTGRGAENCGSPRAAQSTSTKTAPIHGTQTRVCRSTQTISRRAPACPSCTQPLAGCFPNPTLQKLVQKASLQDVLPLALGSPCPRAAAAAADPSAAQQCLAATPRKGTQTSPTDTAHRRACRAAAQPHCTASPS